MHRVLRLPFQFPSHRRLPALSGTTYSNQHLARSPRTKLAACLPPTLPPSTPAAARCAASPTVAPWRCSAKRAWCSRRAGAPVSLSMLRCWRACRPRHSSVPASVRPAPQLAGTFNAAYLAPSMIQRISISHSYGLMRSCAAMWPNRLPSRSLSASLRGASCWPR